MKCVVFCAGEFNKIPSSIISQGDFIICADGGYNHAAAMGITPNLLVGDMDSIKGSAQAGETIELPRDKDDTDTYFALREGLSRGYKEFILLGALGGRLDHTYANIASIEFLLDNNAAGTIISGDSIITMIKNGGREFTGEYKYLSVFAYGGEASGVSISGVKYPLNNATLSPSHPIGISNEIVGGSAVVSVRDGCLVIMQTYDR